VNRDPNHWEAAHEAGNPAGNPTGPGGASAGALRTRQDSPRIGELEKLLGDFLIEEELARTPRAVIYRIRAGNRPERQLALKVALQPVEGEDLDRFQHEVRLLSEVRHPNVVEVYDFGVLPGSFPFLTMELLAASDLQHRVQADWDTFYSVALQAAAGLAHIHRHGIVHLDVKPANLGLVEREDGALGLKILDFGLAQNVRGPLDRRIRGTLAYVAPEVLLQDRYDHRADLYSLGMTLFQLATGVLPSAGNDAAAIRFHLQAEAPDPLAYRPDMPAQLASILRRLLARDPQGRFPSAGRLLLELADVAGRDVDPASMALGEGRVLASRMVGRDDLVDTLRVALARAGRGEPQVVVVEGGEGVGKSRLLREFRLVAAMQGARVGIGRAVATRPEPLRAVRGALRHLGLELEELQRMLGPGEQGERHRLYGRLGDELREAAMEGGPLVLLLEDLHLAGPETHELLGYAAHELGEARLMIVATRRPADAGEPEAEGWPEDGAVHRLMLQPLQPAFTRELVDASLGTEGLPAPLYEWLHDRAEGNPARVQQLLHHLIEERVLRFRQGEWKPSLPSLARLAAPERLQVLDRERLATLPVEDLAVLEAMAVVGEPMHWRRLAELLRVEPSALYAIVAGLGAKGFLEPTPEGAGVYGFAQPALARAVYESLTAERRRDLHRQWAELLAQRQSQGEPELVAAVAEHYWAGGDRAASLPYLLEGAERARTVFGYREAADLFGRAAEVYNETGDSARATESQLKQAEALDAGGSTFRALSLYRALLGRQTGRGRRAEDRLRQAELWLHAGQLYGKLGESDEQLKAAEAGLELLGVGHEVGHEDGQEAGEGAPLEVELLASQAEALYALGRLDDAYATARRALKLATQRRLGRQRGSLLNTLGLIFCRAGEWRKGHYLLKRGLAAAVAADDERLAAKLRNNLGNLYWKRGDWQRAQAQYEANLAAAQRLRDPWTELTALHNLGVLHCGRGEWKAARAPITRSLELRRRLGAREGETVAWLHLGEIEELLGDWARAERHYERVLKLLADNSDHEDYVTAQNQLASLARKRGDWSEAEELARSALAGAERLGDRELLTYCHQQLGLVEKDREHWAPAAAHLARSLELAEGTGAQDGLARLHNSLADLHLRRGEPRDGRRHLAEARRWADALGDRFELAKVLSGEARLAVLESDVDRADELFGQSVRLFEELEVPFEYARTLYEWGVRTRNPEIAVERLDRALVAFERLGAATEFERTRGVMEGIRERHHLGAAGRSSTPGLWEVAKIVNSSLNLKEVLDRTMDLVLERLRADRGMVVLANHLTGDLEIAVARNLGDGREGEGQHLSETVVRKVIDSREPVLAVDALTDARFAGSASIVASHIVSILAVPLVIRDRLAGAIYVDHLRSQHLFGNKDLDFLVAFADQAALAIDNARLYGELEAHRQKLKEENESLRREILSSRHLGALIGKSRAINQLKETIERVAQSSSTILIRGESGTGKGLVARIIHSVSPRREGPFIAFNCAALPETLVESELFGHEKGAFTGATGQKPGRFELAHRGTIFLDEIGKVSMAVQAKLLRVIEDREFERVGGTRTLKSDVRVITATNLNLEDAIAKDEFREDLYYRLNIIPIVLPPLRERREDIPYLVEHFLDKIGRDLGQPRRDVERAVLDLFLSYRWPGNVRELEAAVHRALVLSRCDVLTVEDFGWIASREDLTPRPGASGGVGGNAAGAAAASATPAQRLQEGNYEELSSEFDRELIREALDSCGGKIRETARFLGIARNTLKAKIKRYGLEGASGD
jgi:Nif-specific regulatory protein